MTKTKNANAVVIGGGVMGASILYNLVSRGVGSAVLLERSNSRDNPLPVFSLAIS